MENLSEDLSKNTSQEEDFLLGAEPLTCGINDEECESCQ